MRKYASLCNGCPEEDSLCSTPPPITILANNSSIVSPSNCHSAANTPNSNMSPVSSPNASRPSSPSLLFSADISSHSSAISAKLSTTIENERNNAAATPTTLSTSTTEENGMKEENNSVEESHFYSSFVAMSAGN